MFGVAWTDAVQAVSAIVTPLLVAGLAFYLTRRQDRSNELLRARIDHDNTLAPDLDTLMFCIAFIGRWRDLPPPEVIELKRRTDERFHCAAPLLSPPVLEAYTDFMDRCFRTFRSWGDDPAIRSSAYRRRAAWRREPGWASGWDGMVELADTDVITKEALGAVRQSHDRLVAALVRDLSVTRSRSRYTTDLVALNAHAPVREDIAGLEEDVSADPWAGDSGTLGQHPFTGGHPVAPYHDVAPPDEAPDEER